MLQNTIEIVKGWERSLDRNRKVIPVISQGGSYVYEPQVSVKQDDYIVYCNHVNSEIEDVLVLPDDGALVTVCQVCDKQLIGGEWL